MIINGIILVTASLVAIGFCLWYVKKILVTEN
ncbi:Uncharacterised protein [Campylobacter hyointestinalis]|uniref:Uncharacterized protein n=1 Tax=Campylobacter hyointestinalis subsp. hyointestinalis TaxID=91352 RepID=A0A9W5EZK0_CAMHY|nr:Uncharacterised protein [Campylobacter hyointestinalis subsp. hyointestinalis]CUU89448.1 Uncharacterised protein [Campylobacter hyointestinalis]CUU88858.1 Uncharacterised protein [Campylobacter hyointestinalis subsp. hyointestinalis]CUU89670.1 Uncharacterised protein [Campylobacter hyointestinalis subsp. hyointestinalis]CUU92269.1 Uncharacterised protein [Campylobacter hyointestinalis subsp. hyointestinalis]